MASFEQELVKGALTSALGWTTAGGSEAAQVVSTLESTLGTCPSVSIAPADSGDATTFQPSVVKIISGPHQHVLDIRIEQERGDPSVSRVLRYGNVVQRLDFSGPPSQADRGRFTTALATQLAKS